MALSSSPCWEVPHFCVCFQCVDKLGVLIPVSITIDYIMGYVL